MSQHSANQRPVHLCPAKHSSANQSLKKLWGIVPVKPFDEGKSRLADALSPSERQAVSRRLFTHVMDVIQRAAICEEILVVSRSSEALAHAEELGAIGLSEDLARKKRVSDPVVPAPIFATDPLNAALEQACDYAQSHHASAILIVPADLPLITPRDLQLLTENAPIEPGIVIAPSNDGGTNALLMHPPSAIDFAFGIQSFQQHCDLAQMAGVVCNVFESPNLATDVDNPQDLAPIRSWL